PVKPVNPRSSQVQPYFPGYLFVHTDLHDAGESTFRWMPLSQGLVHVGGEPSSVHEGVIAAIRKRVEVLMETGGLEADALSHGEPVLVREGPFEGYDGVFDTSLSGGERTRILLRMVYDHFVPVDVDRALIRRHS
ncbi:MAG: hypothetical protein MUP44_09810, partial [Anaerolineales bacterium]|nr:hypothetical protein [Anaerolineales bacterium]